MSRVRVEASILDAHPHQVPRMTSDAPRHKKGSTNIRLEGVGQVFDHIGQLHEEPELNLPGKDREEAFVKHFVAIILYHVHPGPPEVSFVGKLHTLHPDYHDI